MSEITLFQHAALLHNNNTLPQKLFQNSHVREGEKSVTTTGTKISVYSYTLTHIFADSLIKIWIPKLFCDQLQI